MPRILYAPMKLREISYFFAELKISDHIQRRKYLNVNKTYETHLKISRYCTISYFQKNFH